MDGVLREMRYALRGIRRQPGFAAAAIAMLTLGIGATTAIFTVVDAVVLEIPFDDPARIVVVRERHRDRRVSRATPLDRYLSWRDAAEVLEAAAAYSLAQPVLVGPDGAERLDAELVTADMFRVLGVKPAFGRVFLDAEDRPGAAPVAIASHRFWVSRLGSNPGALGQRLVLDGLPTTLVGVMPPGFDGPRSRPRVGLWLPLAVDPGSPDPRQRTVMVFARLRKGVTVASAEARLDGIARGLSGGNEWGAWVLPVTQDPLYAETREQVTILVGAVALVLLISCVNVASLLLGRNVSRRRELAIRLAIGAERRHIIRQLVIETLVLTTAGAAGGLVLGWWAISTVVPFMPATVPRVTQMNVDATVLIFAALATLATGLAIALLPAGLASRTHLVAAMRAGDGTGQTAHRMRSALVVVEVALAVLALTAAVLMIASFVRLKPTHPGFSVDDRLTFFIRLSAPRYGTAVARLSLVETLAERLAHLPGVLGVTATSSLPLTGSSGMFPVKAVGVPAEEGRPPNVHYRAVLPRYLTSIDVPIVRGRDLDGRDAAGAEPTAVVNETFARRLFRHREALGAEIAIDEPDGTMVRRIVGIARDARILPADLQARPEVYVPYAQSPLAFLHFVLRMDGPNAGIAAAVRREIRGLDPALPVERVETLAAIAARSVDLPRFLAFLMGSFGAVALLLAALGVYAAASWSVTQRMREIGVRMALGARPSDVRRMILRHGLLLGGIGAALGATGALASTKLLESWLFGLPARQPALLAAVALSFVAIVVLACVIPARRATRIDPMAVLRIE